MMLHILSEWSLVPFFNTVKFDGTLCVEEKNETEKAITKAAQWSLL